MAYKILLIESDAAQADQTRLPLAEAGFEVILAEGSEAAMAALQVDRPDLAMVDAVLPSDAALDLCQELKGGTGASIPVIVLGDSDAEASPDFNDPNGLGCDEYLCRPVEGDELVAICNKLLESVESLNLAGEDFESALDDLDSELDDHILTDDTPAEDVLSADAPSEAQPSDDVQQEEALSADSESPEFDPSLSDPSEDDEGGDILSFRSAGDRFDFSDVEDPVEPEDPEDGSVSKSMRESLDAFEEEENRFSLPDGQAGPKVPDEAIGLDMNTILEQLENSEPQPAPALVQPSAATPEGPGVDPFAQAEEIGHHIDDLFGQDPQTPVAEVEAAPHAKAASNAPDLLGIDDELVVVEGSTADKEPGFFASGAAEEFIPQPTSEESLPGATPFTPHSMEDGNVELAVDGMNDPASGSGMGLKVAAATILLIAAGGAAFWLLPSEPASPAKSESVASSEATPEPVDPIALPVPSTDPTQLTVFDQGAADAAVIELFVAAGAEGTSPEAQPTAEIVVAQAEVPPVKTPPVKTPPAKTVAAKAAPAKTSPTRTTPKQAAPAKVIPKPAAPTEVAAKAVPQTAPVQQAIVKTQSSAIEPPVSEPTAAERYASLADSLARVAARPENGDTRVVYSEDLTVPVTLQPIPGSDFVAPKLIDRPDPKFPVETVRQSAGQTIMLRVHIDESGKVIRIVVQEGQRDGALTAKAIAAVLQSRYRPATIADGTVKAWVLETFTF